MRVAPPPDTGWTSVAAAIALSGQEGLPVAIRVSAEAATESEGFADLSANERLVATASHASFSVWDLASGGLIRSFDVATRPEYFLMGVWLSPRGHLALTVTDVSVEEGLQAALWNVATGRRIGVLKHRIVEISAVAFSRDGGRLLIAGCGEEHGSQCVRTRVELWDLTRGRAVWTIDGEQIASPLGHDYASVGVTGARFGPDGRRVRLGLCTDLRRRPCGRFEPGVFDSPGFSVSLFDSSAKLKTFRGTGFEEEILDASSGTRIETLEVRRPLVFESSGDLALAHTCERVSSSACESRLALWNPWTATRLRQVRDGLAPRLGRIGFGGGGRHLLAAGCVEGSSVDCESGLRIWDAETGELLHRLKGHTGRDVAFAVGADGSRVASLGCLPKTPDPCSKLALRVFDLRDGRQLALASIPGGERPERIGFSGDGAMVMVATRKGPDDRRLGFTRFFDVERKVWKDGLHGRLLAATRDPGAVLVGSRRDSPSELLLTLLSLQTGEVSAVLRGRDDVVLPRVAIGPNRRLLAIRGVLGFQIWDLAEARILRTLPNQTFESAIAFNADATQLAIGDRRNPSSVEIIDRHTGTRIGDPLEVGPEILAMAFHPKEDVLLIGAAKGRLILWRPDEGRAPVALRGHDGDVVAVAFDPTGEVAASADRKGRVIVWDARSGRSLRTLEAGGTLHSVDFGPDSRSIATTGPGQLKLWDLESGSLEREIGRHDIGYRYADLSSDGAWLATTESPDESVKVWDVASGRLLREFPSPDPHEIERHVHFVLGDSRLLNVARGSFTLSDPVSGERIYTAASGDGGKGIAWTPDGYFVGSDPESGKLVNVVRGVEVLSIDQFFERFHNPDLIRSRVAGRLPEAAGVQADLSKGFASPPEVEFVSPVPGARVTAPGLEIEVVAHDRGGGIDEIRLYHNGKLVSQQQRGLELVPAAGLRRSFQLQLIRGRNTLRAVALNGERTESRPAILEVFRDAPEIGARLHVLAVGVNEYRNDAYSLNYAREDARAFRSALEKGGAGIFSTVEGRSLFDAEAVLPSIAERIAAFEESVAPEDVFVFYFAGHGIAGIGEGEQGGFFLIPHDVTRVVNPSQLTEKAIPASLLTTWSRRIPARKQLIVLDACQSGEALEAFGTRGMSQDLAIAQLARSAGIVVLAASGSEQFATEVRTLGHGIFTYALLEGLSGAADGGRAPDGKVTVKELEAYLNDRVPVLSKKHRGATQYPASFAIGQDFPLTTP